MRPNFETSDLHHSGHKSDFNLINKGKRGFFEKIESIDDKYSFLCYHLGRWMDTNTKCQVYGFSIQGTPVFFTPGGLKVYYHDELNHKYIREFTFTNGQFYPLEPIEIEQ